MQEVTRRTIIEILVHHRVHIYAIHAHIYLSFEPQISKKKEALSRIIENLVVVVISCKAKYYWRRGKNEVDIILEQNKKLVPAEVKYSKEIEEKDMKGLLRFMSENKADFGIIISEETLSEAKQDN